MTASHVLAELVIVLGTAAVVTVVFQAVRLPVVLGYVLAGLLIGPHVPVPLVADVELVHVLSELGVILLMFTIGLEMRLSAIARVGLSAALVAVVEVGFAIATGMLVARLLGFDAATAVFAGACVGISSTMLIAKAFEELGWKGGFTELVFAILVFEDLIAIVLLAVLAGVASEQGGTSAQISSGADVAVLLGKLAGFLVLMLVVGLAIVPRLVRWIAARARTETLLIAALALCFGNSVLAASAGYSVALGAFVAGVLIAESGHGHDVFELVKPFRDVFAMVFFVSVGMTIDPALLAAEAPRIAALAAVVLVAKPIGVALGAVLAGNDVRPAVRAGLSLAQIGELSFVIAAIVPRTELLAIAVGVSCVTTLTSPLLVRNSERIAERVAARLPRGIATAISFYEGWLARLRGREPGGWRRHRRAVALLALDATVIAGVAIAAATVAPRELVERGLSETGAGLIAALCALVVIAPFAFAAVRSTTVLARRLATEVIPVGEPVDLGRAPRRLLVAAIELAIALVITMPIVVVIQPFVPGSIVLLAIVALAAIVVVRRSIADFEGHVRAGSELILELISQPNAPPLEQLATILPGFDGVASIVIAADSPAAGRSLADLDLRARTGATVLAIGRPPGGLATPSPSEPLRAGDVLAVAGSEDAVAAARTLLHTVG